MFTLTPCGSRQMFGAVAIVLLTGSSHTALADESPQPWSSITWEGAPEWRSSALAVWTGSEII